MDIDFFRKVRLEEVASRVHDAWWEEKKKQGFHAPLDCPEIAHSLSAEKAALQFVPSCDKCHTDMYPYDELPEHVKEYDRTTVLAVLDALERCRSFRGKRPGSGST